MEKGTLKFYHSSKTEHILSESTVKLAHILSETNPVGNVLFSAPLHPIFIDIVIPYSSVSLPIMLLS